MLFVGTEYLFEINQKQEHRQESGSGFRRNTGSYTGDYTMSRRRRQRGIYILIYFVWVLVLVSYSKQEYELRIQDLRLGYKACSPLKFNRRFW
jgi:hypothetical protein